MSGVGWIKLMTSLPDNKKIKRIRKLPDGNNIILFWVFLLARAGESNKAGGLFLTDTLPYAEDDLAADFDFSTEFVRFALLTLEKYSMIDRFDEILFIKNWEKYQAVEGLEKIREQNRIRQQRYRIKQKELALNAPSNVTDNVTRNAQVTISNAIDKEQDKEEDIDTYYSYCSDQKVTISDVVLFYQNNFGLMSPNTQDDLIHWSNDLSPELVIEAMKKADIMQKPYSYASGILKCWFKSGLTTFEQVEQSNLTFEKNKQQKKQQSKGYYGKAKKVEPIPESMRKSQTKLPLESMSDEEMQANERELRKRMEKLLGEEAGDV